MRRNIIMAALIVLIAIAVHSQEIPLPQPFVPLVGTVSELSPRTPVATAAPMMEREDERSLSPAALELSLIRYQTLASIQYQILKLEQQMATRIEWIFRFGLIVLGSLLLRVTSKIAWRRRIPRKKNGPPYQRCMPSRKELDSD